MSDPTEHGLGNQQFEYPHMSGTIREVYVNTIPAFPAANYIAFCILRCRHCSIVLIISDQVQSVTDECFVRNPRQIHSPHCSLRSLRLTGKLSYAFYNFKYTSMPKSIQIFNINIFF